jgi:hypothetical protein
VGTEITDEYMLAMRPKAREYTLVILRRTEMLAEPGADAIVWEHGRRNHQLRADGVMPIVCPTPEDAELAGVSILDTDLATATDLMSRDPGVRAGLFTFTVHACRGFPGDGLPA